MKGLNPSSSKTEKQIYITNNHTPISSAAHIAGIICPSRSTTTSSIRDSAVANVPTPATHPMKRKASECIDDKIDTIHNNDGAINNDRSVICHKRIKIEDTKTSDTHTIDRYNDCLRIGNNIKTEDGVDRKDDPKVPPKVTAVVVRYNGSGKIECVGEMATKYEDEDELLRPLQDVVREMESIGSGGDEVENRQMLFDDENEEITRLPTPSSSRGNLIVSRGGGGGGGGGGGEERWRAHRIAEEYIDLVGNVMFPGTFLAPFGYDPASGQYPIEQVTALGILTSPLRRPTVVEKWSPYEIATFEASLALFGKQFHQLQKFVRTKSTKEIIEFFYVWKKTGHYKVWKKEFKLHQDLDKVDTDED